MKNPNIINNYPIISKKKKKVIKSQDIFGISSNNLNNFPGIQPEKDKPYDPQRVGERWGLHRHSCGQWAPPQNQGHDYWFLHRKPSQHWAQKAIWTHHHHHHYLHHFEWLLLVLQWWQLGFVGKMKPLVGCIFCFFSEWSGWQWRLCGDEGGAEIVLMVEG